MDMPPATTTPTDLDARVGALPWADLTASLDETGHAVTPVLLAP